MMRSRIFISAFAILVGMNTFGQGAAIAAIAQKGEKWGMINGTGTWVIQPNFDEIQDFDASGLALAKQGLNWGMINKKGEWTIQPQFTHLREFEDGFAMAEKDDKWVVVNEKGDIVFNNAEYTKIDWLHNGIVIGDIKKSMVYVDVATGNKLTTPAVSEKLYPYSEGLARFNSAGKWGYLDKTGAYKIALQFEDADDFKNGRAKVKKAGKWGYIDQSGAWLIPAEFDDINSFKNGNAIAKKGEKYCIIDESGKLLLEAKYEALDLFENDLALATLNGKQGFVKRDGTWMDIPSGTLKAWSFSEGYAMIKKELGVGYINTAGVEVVKAQYAKGFEWSGPFGRVQKGEQWCFVDATGKEFPVANAQKLYTFHTGLACFKANEMYGYVDANGAVVIKADYTSVEDEFLSNVMSGGGMGLFKKSSYQEPNRDKNGFIIVKKGEKYGAIDKTGKIVIPIEFDDIKMFYSF